MNLNMVKNILIAVTVWTCICVQNTDGHGRLSEPPSRSTMFRYGFDNPPNWTDNQLFCGGRNFQISHGGKCGVCGDAWNGIQDNANGGYYGNGIITKSYEVGELIDVTVDITAQHWGWFEFDLCPLTQEQREFGLPETEACFQILPLANGQYRYDISRSDSARKYHLKLQLPDTLACEQCVLRWRYRTGNHNGCEYGVCGLGVGPQEWFYGCSDIRIRSTGDGSVSTTTSSETTSPPATTQPTTATTLSDYSDPDEDQSTTSESTTPPPPPPPPTTQPTTSTTRGASTQATNNDILRRWREDQTLSVTCEPSEQQKMVPGMDTWCVNNCFHNPSFCPISYCRCSIAEPCQRFVATGEHEGKDYVDDFCQFQCLNDSHDECPEFCECDDSHQSRPACQATGDMEQVAGYGDFCNALCTPAYCPQNCICTFD